VKHTNQLLSLAPNSTLGIISHKLHYIRDGEYYTTGGFTDYVEGLAAHFKQIILMVPVSATNNVAGLRKVSCKGYRIHPLWGCTERTVIAWLARSYIRCQTKKAFADCDIVNVRFFHMISLIALPVVEAMNKHIFLSFVGQVYGGIREKSGLRAVLVKKVKAALRKHLTFVHGWYLVDMYNLDPRMCLPAYSSTYHLAEIRKDPILPPMENEPIRLIFVGRLDSDKGIDIILRALAGQPKLSQKFKLDIVGDGSARTFLEKMVKTLHLQRIITFHGYVAHGEKWDKIMSMAHVMTFVPWHEGAPKVVIEALRFGLPVLASKVGAIPTVIQENVNGWLVEAGRPDQVIDKLKLISDLDQTTWKIISENNLKSARSHTVEEESRNTVQSLIDRKLLPML
jgi:glycosyltransferase involved in cell wall biosynthesis